MPLTLGLAMLVSAAFGTASTTASSSALTVPPAKAFVPQTQTVAQYVQSYFSDIPIMADIAACESKNRQFGHNGTIMHGEVVSTDTGVMQINSGYHGAEAKKLGLDLNTIEGNVEFARYLYEEQGTMPWISSSKCWASSPDDITTGPENSSAKDALSLNIKSAVQK